MGLLALGVQQYVHSEETAATGGNIRQFSGNVPFLGSIQQPPCGHCITMALILGRELWKASVIQWYHIPGKVQSTLMILPSHIQRQTAFIMGMPCHGRWDSPYRASSPNAVF